MRIGFRNRLLLKWSQCKHSRRNECRYPEFESVFGQCSGPSPAPSSYTSSKKGTVRRDWNDVDNRNGRDVLEKRQRRETEGAVFETRGTGKEDGLDVLRDVLLRLRSLSAYVHVYIRELAHARPPMPSISLVLKQLIMCTNKSVQSRYRHCRHDRGKLEQSCGARIDPRLAVRYLGKRSALD